MCIPKSDWAWKNNKIICRIVAFVCLSSRGNPELFISSKAYLRPHQHILGFALTFSLRFFPPFLFSLPFRPIPQNSAEQIPQLEFLSFSSCSKNLKGAMSYMHIPGLLGQKNKSEHDGEWTFLKLKIVVLQLRNLIWGTLKLLALLYYLL